MHVLEIVEIVKHPNTVCPIEFNLDLSHSDSFAQGKTVKEKDKKAL